MKSAITILYNTTEKKLLNVFEDSRTSFHNVRNAIQLTTSTFLTLGKVQTSLTLLSLTRKVHSEYTPIKLSLVLLLIHSEYTGGWLSSPWSLQDSAAWCYHY